MKQNQIILLIILFLTTCAELFIQGRPSLRLRGLVKKSSMVTISKDQNTIDYIQNNKEGTRITIDNKSFEHHSPGKFQIQVSQEKHFITIQTI